MSYWSSAVQIKMLCDPSCDVTCIPAIIWYLIALSENNARVKKTSWIQERRTSFITLKAFYCQCSLTLVLIITIFYFVETPQIIYSPKLSICKPGSSSVEMKLPFTIHMSLGYKYTDISALNIIPSCTNELVYLFFDRSF